MAGEGRKEEREKEKEAGLGAFVNGGAKETPESVLSPGTPFRISKKSGPQSWGSGGGAQPPKGELSTGYPYTSIHMSPSVSASPGPTHPTSPGSHTHPTGPGQFKSSSTAFPVTASSSRDRTLLCRAPGHLLAQL